MTLDEAVARYKALRPENYDTLDAAVKDVALAALSAGLNGCPGELEPGGDDCQSCEDCWKAEIERLFGLPEGSEGGKE